RNLMLDMSEEFADTHTYYDRVPAGKAAQILAQNGITHARVAASVNRSGRDGGEGTRVVIEAYGKGTLTCSAEQLVDEISAALQKQFDCPDIIADSGKFRLSMHESARYSVECGFYQLSKSGQRSCGDYYDSFVDGKGYAYVILSDGMGSGSRARIDSAFACGMLTKLLRAGISLSSAIEVINNALLVKSSDESFATLDICKIDLFTGQTKLYKAGAAPSYIRCNQKVIKTKATGLPIGIGHKPVYESQSFTIGNSDMVIMASDGAQLNEQWLEHKLNLVAKGEAECDLNETAKTLAAAARFTVDLSDDDSGNPAKAREDDISVIAVKLVK
ncbi:MAG: SpoIIE family protein phosphatase, partial [Oscillospiraceae bacterium]|nr:SpoIIE family protein phosphatase [Oscillospiraceae bacterium]